MPGNDGQYHIFSLDARQYQGLVLLC